MSRKDTAPDPLVLTFDVGTQSTRAVLVDPGGNVLGKVKLKYPRPYYSLQPGWAEQDPGVYWSAICQTARELRAQTPDLWDRITAVTCICIRGTAVCLDRDGAPVRDAILWLDKRKIENIPPLSRHTSLMFRVAGLTRTIDTLRTHMYCSWVALNEPELWEKTACFSLLSTYFNVKFTGVLKDSSANMCGLLPYDAKNHRWYPRRDFHRELYLIDDSRLVPLVEPGTVLGGLIPAAAEAIGVPPGLPFIVTGSDKMSEALGLSCTTPDKAAISLGTLSSVQVPSKRFFNMYTILPPFPSLTGDFLNELQTYRGFWLVSWFKEEFGREEMAEAERLGCSAEELLDQHLKDVPPGCDGLIMQPTLTPDALTPHARGVFLGLAEHHTRMHFFRAIIEGIGFTLYDGLISLEKAGRTKVRRAYIAGGGSSSAEICQIMSDILGLPVCRIQTPEASALGSSILAFVTLGVYPDVETALHHMVHETQHFDPDRQIHALYHRFYTEVYRRIFGKLVKLYRNIDNICLK